LGKLEASSHATAPVRMDLSFRSKAGIYCRTFALQGDDGSLARLPRWWRLARGRFARAAGTASGGVDQAGSECRNGPRARLMPALPANLRQRREAAARERQWRD